MAKVTDFATELSERYGLSAVDAESFITAMFDVVCRQLETADRQVKVKGLGTFKLTSVGARASIDVNTGQRIILEGRNKVTFTPEALLRDRVNKPFVQFETVILNDGVDFSEIDREFENECGTQEEDNTEDADEKVIAEDVDGDGKATGFARDDDTVDSGNEPETAEPVAEESTDSGNEPEAAEPVAEESTDSGNEPETAESTAEKSADCDDEPETAEPAAEKSTDSGNEPEMAESAAEKSTDSGNEPETAEPAAEKSVDRDDEPEMAEPAVVDDIVPKAEGSETVSASPLKETMVCKQRSPRLMYWLTTASFLLLLCIGLGMYMLYRQMEAKNQAIEQLQNKLAIQSAAEDKVGVADTGRMPNVGMHVADHDPKVSADVDGGIDAKVEKNTVKSELDGQVKSDGANDLTVPSLKSKMNNGGCKTKAKVDDKKSKEIPDKTLGKVSKTSDADATIHSSDVRLRTGAYIIVGTEKTVTVRKGQTLASISKANFGPGMECYVEAYNNCKTVKPGDKLKIPKLKLKKLQHK